MVKYVLIFGACLMLGYVMFGRNTKTKSDENTADVAAWGFAIAITTLAAVFFNYVD